MTQTPVQVPIIRIHGIKGARSACRVFEQAPFMLLSPQNAALSHGAQWFADLVQIVRDEFNAASFQAVLDCRGRVSGALAAIETGLGGVIIDALPDREIERLRDMGRQKNCEIFTSPPNAADICEMEDHRLPDHELDKRLKAHIG